MRYRKVAYRVARLQLVDPGEGCAVRRPVSGHVDELALTRHIRVRVAAGPLPERVVVGSVDEDHVQSEPRHADPADRLSRPCVHAVAARNGAKSGELRSPLGSRRGHRLRLRLANRRSRDEVGNLPFVAFRELMLFHPCIERGEGFLPLPNDESPGDQRKPGDEEGGAERAYGTSAPRARGAAFLDRVGFGSHRFARSHRDADPQRMFPRSARGKGFQLRDGRARRRSPSCVTRVATNQLKGEG
jgi:hypothetical protein